MLRGLDILSGKSLGSFLLPFAAGAAEFGVFPDAAVTAAPAVVVGIALPPLSPPLSPSAVPVNPVVDVGIAPESDVPAGVVDAAASSAVFFSTAETAPRLSTIAASSCGPVLPAVNFAFPFAIISAM